MGAAHANWSLLPHCGVSLKLGPPVPHVCSYYICIHRYSVGPLVTGDQEHTGPHCSISCFVFGGHLAGHCACASPGEILYILPKFSHHVCTWFLGPCPFALGQGHLVVRTGNKQGSSSLRSMYIYMSSCK